MRLPPLFAAPLLLLTATFAAGQAVPGTINYQGRLTDNTPQQNPLTVAVPMAFAIWDTAAAGSQLWAEPASGGTMVTVTGGVFSLTLGASVPIPAAVFTGASSSRYLQITLNPGAGNQEILAPRQLLASTGYANLAQYANTAASAAALAAKGGNCPAGQYAAGVDTAGNAVGCTAANTGTVTSISAGAGLTGGAITSSGTIALSVPVALASGGTGATSATANPYYQSRVNGTCPGPGNFMQSVNMDGTVNCGAPPAYTAGPGLTLTGTQFSLQYFSSKPEPVIITTLDTTGSANRVYNTITTGSDGLGLISYSLSNVLKVAHCANPACSAATLSTIDVVTSTIALAIGADGLALISYKNAGLKVAHCSDVPCTGATVTALDTAGTVGAYSSLVIGSDGLGLISYWDQLNNHLKVAHCTDTLCTSATLTTVDATAGVGKYTSITVGRDGLGLISYTGIDAVNIAHCSDLACSSATLSPLDVTAGHSKYFTSIALGADGYGLVSYVDAYYTFLKVAHCANTVCTSASSVFLDTTGVGDYTSLAIGTDHLGMISYNHAGDNLLKLAHCGDFACSTANVSTADSVGSMLAQSSITLGGDGFPLISYENTTPKQLRVEHCPNALCILFFPASVNPVRFPVPELARFFLS